MQDLDKVNQMFNKMFLGSGSKSSSSSNSTTTPYNGLGDVSMTDTTLKGASMASVDLSGDKVSDGSFLVSGAHFKQPTMN